MCHALPFAIEHRSVPVATRPRAGAKGAPSRRLTGSLLATIALAVGAVGCGDQGSSPVGIAAEESRLEMAVSSVEIDNGESFTLQLVWAFPDGRQFTAHESARWSTSDEAVATVSGGGVVSTQLPGEVRISASIRGHTAEATVRSRITLADLRLEIPELVEVVAHEGGDALLSARVMDAASRPVVSAPIEFQVTYDATAPVVIRTETDDQGRGEVRIPVGTEAGERVVRVRSLGLPAAAGAPPADRGNRGGAQGEEDAEELAGEVRVKVRPGRPEVAQIVPGDLTMEAGEIRDLEAQVHDRFGNEVGDLTLRWSSSAPDAVAVDGEGRVTAREGGEATVSVEARGGTGAPLTAHASVAVNGPVAPEAMVRVSGSGQRGTVGATLPAPLQVRINDARGEPLEGVEVLWAVSSGAARVTQVRSHTDDRGIAESWVELGSEAGESVISATSWGLQPVHFGVAADAPAPPPVQNPGRVGDLAVTGATEGSVTLRFTEVGDGTGSAADYQIRYRESGTFGNWGTATVTGSGSCASPVRGTAAGATRTCSVEGLRPGADHTFQLVAFRTSGDGPVYGELSNIASGRTDSQASGTEPVSLHLSASRTQLTGAGDQVQLQVQARDAQGNSVSLPSLAWHSSNPDVATVNATGLVTARAAGSLMISVFAACCGTESLPIVVHEPTVQEPGNPRFSNEPAGFEARSDNPWQTLTLDGGTPVGWGHLNLRGEGRLTSVPTAPDGTGGSVLEFFYPQGMADGHEPARVSHSLSGQREVFVGMYWKTDPDWVRGAVKVHMLQFTNGGWLWVDMPYAHTDPTLHLRVGHRGFGQEFRQNPARLVPYTPGEWVKLEWHVRQNDPGQANGMIRLWQDGELIVSAGNLVFPGNFVGFQHAGTWGGGNPDVPQDQSWYVSHTYISTPR